MQGLKSTWNYIDGCMIKAILEMYAITKEDKYLKFADDFIDCLIGINIFVPEVPLFRAWHLRHLTVNKINCFSVFFFGIVPSGTSKKSCRG